MDAGPVEIRILGSLIEKQRTTPDAYPLSLNSLRLACNQTTNRDPVVSYDEPTIRTALQELSTRKWVRLASGPGSRAAKYRHLLDDALGLGPPELAVLAVLMLRGAQTPGELRQRSERLHRFEAPDGLDRTLPTLAERGFVALQPRRNMEHGRQQLGRRLVLGLLRLPLGASRAPRGASSQFHLRRPERRSVPGLRRS